MFPPFAEEWALEGMPPEDGLVDSVYYEWKHHHVLQVFLDYFSSNAAQFSSTQVKKLGDWLNEAVAAGGDLENAVSTCFLEHMHQVRIDGLLSPHLSNEARRRSHA